MFTYLKSGRGLPHSKSWRLLAPLSKFAKRLGVRQSSAALGAGSTAHLDFTILVSMPEPSMHWPHAPMHQLSEMGTYFVTGGTYLKAHHFRGANRLRVLHRGLLTVAHEYGWLFEAWAVFSNHFTSLLIRHPTHPMLPISPTC